MTLQWRLYSVFLLGLYSHLIPQLSHSYILIDLTFGNLPQIFLLLFFSPGIKSSKKISVSGVVLLAMVVEVMSGLDVELVGKDVEFIHQ